MKLALFTAVNVTFAVAYLAAIVYVTRPRKDT